ncbi:MAG: DUF421 domain-containing protein [Clostridia bacterium]|nr:DUF421 domain-containing protein [Clostridia bacterium]
MEIFKVVLTTLLSVVVLFITAKALGHKQMSQLDFFDYITGITVGSIAAELATELEEPLRPLIAIIIYGFMTFLLNFITSKLPKSRKFINGSPTIVMNNGKLYRKNLKKAKLDLSEFLVMCRQQGYFNIRDIHTAVFEYNGRLTILPISSKRPVTPEDMKIPVAPEHILTEVIMEGRVLNENLKRRGLDLIWLQKELKLQGVSNQREIFLGLCDANNKLVLYKNE